MVPLFAAQVYAVSASNIKGMLFSCWAIVLVLTAMSFTFLRFGKKEYSVAILPLMITPLANIISGIAASFLSKFIKLSQIELRVIIILTAGLLSCLLLGLVSRGLEGRRTRRVFFWCCAVFVVVLTIVLVTTVLISARG